MLKAEGTATIVKIGGTDAVRQHLSELGFTVGEQIKVISNISGNLILQVKGARIALDHEMASKVNVNSSH
jgi:hypothetical protein